MSPLSSTAADCPGEDIFFASELSRTGGGSLCATEVERFAAARACDGLIKTEKRPIAIPKQKATTPIVIENFPRRFIVTRIVDLFVQLLKRKSAPSRGRGTAQLSCPFPAKRLGAA